MMKNHIQIIEKPESVSWEEIQSLLHRAHESNKKIGLNYATADQSAERLKAKIGDKGICLVAFDGDKLVGTGTVDFRILNKWYHKGEAAHLGFLGVVPEYKGRHLGLRLAEARWECAKEYGMKVIYTSSAEGNLIVRNLNIKNGFKKVDYYAYKSNNFYSVVYAKWLDGCPFSDAYINFRYNLRRAYIRLRYKPGKIKRFGV